jgi:hypothetical protein
MSSRRAQWVVWNGEQGLADSEKLQGRNNIGAAALASLAASFESRAPSYVWSAGEVCTYGGALWMFDANHSGAWTGADAHEVKVETLIAGVRTGLVFAGNLTDGVNVTIPQNNSWSTLTTSRASITLEITITPDDPLPNFAVQINNSAALTLIVKVNLDAGGGAPIVVSYAAYPFSVGRTLDACSVGEINQVTCVGGCWTWAKFLDGSPSP